MDALGRLDQHLHLKLPKTEDRLRIIKMFASTIAVDGSPDYQALATRTEKLTGADIEACFRSVTLHSSLSVFHY